jgi:ABC-2 type transport system ATP-binding protein
VIRHGRLLAEGRPDDLRANRGGHRLEISGAGFANEVLSKLRIHPAVRSATPADEKLLLELNDGSKAAPLVRLLVESGAEIEEVRRVNVSLEDVFLSLVEEDRDGE